MRKNVVISCLALMLILLVGCSDDSDGDSIFNPLKEANKVDIKVSVACPLEGCAYAWVSVSEEIVDPDTFGGEFQHILLVDGEDVSDSTYFLRPEEAGFDLAGRLVPGESCEISYTYKLLDDDLMTFSRTVEGTVQIAYPAVWEFPYEIHGLEDEAAFSWTLDADNPTQVAWGQTSLVNTTTWETAPVDEFFSEIGAEERAFTFPANCLKGYQEVNNYYLQIQYTIATLDYVRGKDFIIISSSSISVNNMSECNEFELRQTIIIPDRLIEYLAR